MSTKLRTSKVSRKSSETDISIAINLDSVNNEPSVSVSTGYGFADHMLTLMAFWAGFDLEIKCKGDTYIDAHHTVEDIGICLGMAFLECLEDRKGIARTAFAKVPMDEALAEVCVDISGRAYHVMKGEELLPAIIAGEEKDLWREFFKAFASGAKMNIHVIFHYGQNGHHLLESAFKSLGLALKNATILNRTTLLSTKGRLD